METSAGPPTAPTATPLNTTQTVAVVQTTSSVRRWTPWVVCASVSVVFLFVALTFGPMESWFSWRQLIVQQVMGGEYVLAKNQSIVGDSITISKVRLNKPGYVTARFVDEFDSPSDYLVGETEVLPVGVHENVVIPIDPNNLIDQPHVPVILQSGSKVIILEYYHDPTIDYHKEAPVRDVFGQTILGMLTIL